MSLTTLSAIAATIIFTSFAVVVAVGIVADTLSYIAENFTNEIKEIPVEHKQEFLPDDFEMLYINVADGDKNDCNYWLECVKGVHTA